MTASRYTSEAAKSEAACPRPNAQMHAAANSSTTESVALMLMLRFPRSSLRRYDTAEAAATMRTAVYGANGRSIIASSRPLSGE